MNSKHAPASSSGTGKEVEREEGGREGEERGREGGKEEERGWGQNAVSFSKRKTIIVHLLSGITSKGFLPLSSSKEPSAPF